MQSRVVETIEASGKHVICTFEIENVTYSIYKRNYITNKWLQALDWLQIYGKLGECLAANRAAEDIFEAVPEFITLDEHLHIGIRVEDVDNDFYSKLLNLEPDECHAKLLHIKVGRQKIEATDSNVRASNRNKKKRRRISHGEYNPVTVGRRTRNSVSKAYAPYTPSKRVQKVEEIDEPYSPKPLSTEEESPGDPYVISSSVDSPPKGSAGSAVPSYKPSEIKSPSEAANGVANSETIEDSSTPMESTQSVRFRSTSRQRTKPRDKQNRKRECSEDLFESEEEVFSKKHFNQPGSDGAKRSSRRRTPVQQYELTPLAGRKKHSKRHTAKGVQRKEAATEEDAASGRHLKDWLSKDSPKQDDERAIEATNGEAGSSKKKKKEKTPKKQREKDKKYESPSKSKRSEDSPFLTPDSPAPLPSIEEMRESQEENEREQIMYENLSKQIEKMNKPPPDVKILSLNSISVNDLVGTFEEFRAILDEQFNERKHQKRFGPDKDQLHLLIMNVINRSRSMPMMDYLQNRYEPNCDGVPTYTDLFVNIMLPEWVLRIFMKEFCLNRHNAIKHIQMQQEREALDCSQMF